MQHEKNVAEIEKLKTEVELETKFQIKSVAAEARKAVALIEANNILKLAE